MIRPGGRESRLPISAGPLCVLRVFASLRSVEWRAFIRRAHSRAQSGESPLPWLLALTLLAGCRSHPASPSPEVARLVTEAGQKRAMGDTEGAKAALDEALHLAPDDPRVLVALGRMQLLDFSDPDAALATYRHAARVAPSDPDARYGLGQQLHFQGQVEAARAQFREALRLRAGWSHAAAWLGATELEATPADVPAAIRHLEAAAADGHYAFARYQLGRAYGQALRHAGRETDARRALKRFRELDIARREQRARNVRRRAGAEE